MYILIRDYFVKIINNDKQVEKEQDAIIEGKAMMTKKE
jgi:hypothetical protein